MFVLARLCREQVLPRPNRTGSNFPTVERAGVVYMDALLDTRRHPTALSRLIETGIATKSFAAHLVPVSIFWGRASGKATSLWRSEERRVGQECDSTCITRWPPDTLTKKNSS